MVGTEVDAQIYCPDFEWPLKIKRAIVRWIDKDVFGVEFLEMLPAQKERMRMLLVEKNSESGKRLWRAASGQNHHPASIFNNIPKTRYARTDAAVMRGNLYQNPFVRK